MHTIAGYHITEHLYESARTQVYRAIRLSDRRRVVLKLLTESYPSPERIAWFKREYEIVRNLQIDGATAAYNLEENRRWWVMVLEDFGGVSLRQARIAGTLDLTTFLELAIKITDALGQVHQCSIIHKDINPSNIVYNPTTGTVKIIDFGISTTFLYEDPARYTPGTIQGTLAYVSPEQTGRMNRTIDYRTDFYSLGVLLYELITGILPFSSNDALEMVHYHLAHQPVPPHEYVAYHKQRTIPSVISSIILKLMAKEAEQRYQSTNGLRTDLTRCLHEWQETGDIRPFALGQHDISERFHIPQKLYGREPELEHLLAGFERVCRGSREILFITGAAGIGKSALVREIYKPMARERGYLIAGKFDQFQRDVPYTAFIQAFRNLIRNLLAESETNIESWREQCLNALGPNGKVITDIIPEVAHIIGKQPDVPELLPAEARNRFHRTFQQFIEVFTRNETPLVLFLDDVQWADSASLKLLETLMCGADSRYLFVIGAYRDTEVGNDHELWLTTNALAQANVPVQTLVLQPLTESNIVHLVADTLSCDVAQVHPLATLIANKTGGNPFFLNEFFKNLHREGLIWFVSDASSPGWQWDIARIQTLAVTDNVVDLMMHTMKNRLAPASLTILTLAACIGNHFDLKALATVSEQSQAKTAQILDAAIKEGLIISPGSDHELAVLDVEGLLDYISTDYHFVHDRIQQAAYLLIPETQRAAIHWHIGTLLIERFASRDVQVRASFWNAAIEAEHTNLTQVIGERLFSIVNHLNQGHSCCANQDQRLELVMLNLLASKQAKSSAAYEPAYHYVIAGIEILTASSDDTWNPWTDHYTLTCSVYTTAAELAYLCTNFDQMEQFGNIIRKHATTLLDKVAWYEVLFQSYIAQNKLAEAIETGRSILTLLGETFPAQPTPADIMESLQHTQALQAEKQKENIIALPTIEDPLKRAAMRLLAGLTIPAYNIAPDLLALIILRMITLSLRYGQTTESAFAYGLYGLMLAGAIGDIDGGYGASTLALQLLERMNVQSSKARTFNVIYCCTRHWKDHVSESLKPLQEGYHSGLETGDFAFAALNIHTYCYHSLYMGKNLVELEHEMQTYGQSIAQIHQETALHFHQFYHQTVRNLIGRDPEPCILSGDVCDETIALPHHLAADNRTALFVYYFNKTVLCYLFKQYTQAIEHANQARTYIDTAVGLFLIPLLSMYDSLARLTILRTSIDDATQPEETHPNTIDLRTTYLTVVQENQEKLKYWAHHAPSNHLHRYELVEAERAWVEGNYGATREYYDAAIDHAYDNGFINDMALASECAGQFYLHRGNLSFATICLQQAYEMYQKWGATAKLHEMVAYYADYFQGEHTKTQLHESAITNPFSGTTPEITQTKTSSSTLDVASIIKASQTISGQIVLEKLLSQVMHILIENAGAERGVLILEHAGTWYVEAEGTIGHGRSIPPQPYPIETLSPSSYLPLTMIAYVARTAQHIVVHNALQQGEFTHDPYILAHKPLSVLCTPLFSQARMIGILYLENTLTTEVFTTDRLTLLHMLSSQAVISIENARLYAHLEASEYKYRSLFEDSRDVIFVTTPQGRFVAMNPAGLHLFGYTQHELETLHVENLYVNPEDRHRFIRKLESQGMVRDYPVQLCRQDGTCLECLITANVRYSSDGTPKEYNGIIRDITEQKQAEQERIRLAAIEHELTLAQNFQQRLLPSLSPDWPEFDIVCYTQPAREVGGDFYMYQILASHGQSPEKCFAVAIGDVTGKGMPAAFLMSVSLATIHTIITRIYSLQRQQRLSDMLRELSRGIETYTKTTLQNCAFAYVEITKPAEQPDATIVRMANAGCVPPIVKKVDGSTHWLETGGLPLGCPAELSVHYPELVLTLKPGDMIILTSDGVIEATSPNPHHHIFSFDRLVQCIEAGPSTSASDMLIHLQAELATFVGSEKQHDDITIIVVRV